jgi:hypothetical protein
MASKSDGGLPIPRKPSGWKGSGNLLHDLNEKYGRAVLNDKDVRARIRHEYGQKVDVKRIDGEWRIVGKTQATS